MESPVKQPVFAQEEKENVISDDVAVPVKGIPMYDEPEPKETSVAPTIKNSEADEPLLQENPNRFVLFPIKYHEVRELFFSTRPRRVMIYIACMLTL